MTTEYFTRTFHTGAAERPNTVPVAPPAARRHRTPLFDKLYDTTVAGLIVLSGAVALYRLIWMGQP